MAKKSDFQLIKFFTLLGSRAGSILSIAGLIGIGFGCGSYIMKLEKETEIIEIRKDHFIELKQYVLENERLERENLDLKDKITDYEQNDQE